MKTAFKALLIPIIPKMLIKCRLTTNLEEGIVWMNYGGCHGKDD